MKILKTIVTVLWTIVMVVVFCFGAVYSTREEVYTGLDLTFQVDSNTNFVINAPAGATLAKAESEDFFLFRKESGEVIYGTPSQPDLSWRHTSYFKAPSGPIPNGEWVVDGTPTVYLTSPENMVVLVVMADQWSTIAPILVFSVLIYLAGLWCLSCWKTRSKKVEEQQ